MNSRIKLSARAAMCGSYPSIIPLFGLSTLILVVFSFLNAILDRYFSSVGDGFLASAAIITVLVSVALTSCLRLVMQIRYLCFARGRRCVKPQIGLREALNACDLSVRLFLLKLFWFAVFEGIPVASVLLFGYQLKNDTVSLKAACAVATGLSFLAVAGLVFWLIFIQRYSKSVFYLACYKDFTAVDAIRESVRKSKNSVVEIFLFKLSFVPWLLLCLLVLPAFYVVPYYKQCVTCRFLSR